MGNNSWFKKATQNDDSLLYHGTNNEFPINEWQTTTKSENSTTFGIVQTTRHGIFLTNNPDFAKQYGRKLVTVKAKLNNTAQINPELKYQFVQSIDPFNERELWLAAKHSQHDWGLFEGQTGERFVQWLQRQGYDSATFPETIGDPEIEGKTTVVFNPQQLTPVSI